MNNQAWLKRLFLLLGSLTFVYFLFELVLFKPMLPWLPLISHDQHLQKELRVFAQSSKKGLTPKNYIALVGDSYAQGHGDWAVENLYKIKAPYQASHLLYQQTGTDVVSFGSGGASNPTSYVAETLFRYKSPQLLFKYHFDPPQKILAYFFEGNDLDDNLACAKEQFFPIYGKEAIYEREKVKEFFDDIIIANNWSIKRKLIDHHLHHNLVFGGFIARIIMTTIQNVTRPTKNNWEFNTNGSTNVSRIAGQEVHIPDELQAPSIQLKPDEQAVALILFEESILRLRDLFPQSKVGVVYIPSALSTYDIVSADVSIYPHQEQKTIYPRELVNKRSDEIYKAIENILNRHHIPLVDARPMLREAAKNEMVHGPKDWHHFNRKGYEALTKALKLLVNTMDSD